MDLGSAPQQQQHWWEMFLSQAHVGLIYIRGRCRSVTFSALRSRGAGGRFLKGFPGKARGASNPRALREARASLSEPGCRHGACRSISVLATRSGTGRPRQPEAKGASDGKGGAGKDAAAETRPQVKCVPRSGATGAFPYLLLPKPRLAPRRSNHTFLSFSCGAMPAVRLPR